MATQYNMTISVEKTKTIMISADPRCKLDDKNKIDRKSNYILTEKWRKKCDNK